MSENAAINKFKESLAKLLDYINRIFCGEIYEKKYSLQLYTLVYDHCSSSLTSLAESKLFKTATGRQRDLLAAGLLHDGGRIVGGVLYYNIENYLISFVKNLLQTSDDMSNEDLLQFYVDQWNKYRSSNLKCLFEPIRRMRIVKNKLKPIIKDHIYQIGYQSIEQISATATNDPKIYVKTIVEIYEKFTEFIQEIFLNDSVSIDALNQACNKFINTNVVTDAGRKSSELLAHYCNNLLRNNKKILQEAEFEKNLDDFMIVFNYIEDKDAFELFHRKLLSKRVINQQSISDDYEEMIISKLKQTFGLTYTSKLEKILQDINLSKDLMNEYQTYCKDRQITHTFHFSGMIFSSNSWTLSISNDFTLPEEFQSVLIHFTRFYTSHHNGRKLKLLSQYSTSELEMCFTKQRYFLQVSTYQMIILLLFNQSTEWTMQQIQNRTKLNLELLLANLHNLLKFKILISNENSTVRIAEDFRNNKIRINLNVHMKSVEQKDIEGVHQTIDVDRKLLIQATITRIMKARQISKYALLMQEVIQQLNSRFKPEVSIIKKCIDILIEKEYLERDSKEKDLLRYLA